MMLSVKRYSEIHIIKNTVTKHSKVLNGDLKLEHTHQQKKKKKKKKKTGPR